jgi:Ni,Fe-hydrogenase I cytochrome b subunit
VDIWIKVLSAALLVGMLVFIYPRMRNAMQNAPKGTQQDWMGYIIPVLAVAGFIFLLVMLVRH